MKGKRAKSRTSRLPAPRAGGLDAETVSLVRDLLNNVAWRLEMVVTPAVHKQSADHDKDIATVLEGSVTDELKCQIKRLDRITQPQSKEAPAKRDSRRATGLDKFKEPELTPIERELLDDVRYRLYLVVACLYACRKSLEEENADWGIETASMLNRAVVLVVHAQISRIRRIANTPKRRTPKSRAVR